MKLLITTIILVALAFGPATNNRNVDNASVIAHFTPEVAAEFAVGQNYFLDIDNDGTDDFSFTTASFYSGDEIHTKYLVHALNSNELLSWHEYAIISDNQQEIEADSQDMQWRNGAGEIIERITDGSSSKWDGLFSGDRDQYLAVKLVKNGNDYLGWVQVTIDPKTEKAQVLQYAVNRIPSAPIQAGQVM